MIYLLSEEGRQALQAAIGTPTLYAFDFDGTLAPISPDREAVTVSPVVRELLHQLATRVPCAVVSGRSLADLALRVDGAVSHLIGNHGIEGPLSSHADFVEAERVCALWKGELIDGLARSVIAQGAEVEDKRYSLTVHLRRTKDPDRASVDVLGLLRRLVPEPHIVMGTYSLNVLPIGQGGKGAAALALMRQLGRNRLLYIGDEETDETVFAIPNGVVMGIRIGQSADSHAGFYLRHQGEIEEVLRLLVHCVGHLADLPNREGFERHNGQSLLRGSVDLQEKGN